MRINCNLIFVGKNESYILIESLEWWKSKLGSEQEARNDREQPVYTYIYISRVYTANEENPRKSPRMNGAVGV